jgi:hypothetical protein
LAKLPPAPPKQPKSWASKVGSSLWDGMSFMSDGLAKKVADTAVDLVQVLQNFLICGADGGAE